MANFDKYILDANGQITGVSITAYDVDEEGNRFITETSQDLVTYVIVGGFEYIEHGPNQIDKITIEATQLNKSLNVTNGKEIYRCLNSNLDASFDRYKPINPGNPKRNVPYSKVNKDNSQTTLPFNQFYDVVEGSMHHLMAYQDTLNYKAFNENKDEHDGLFFIRTIVKHKPVHLKFTFYSIIPENGIIVPGPNNAYITIGTLEIDYLPDSSISELVLDEAKESEYLPQYYDLLKSGVFDLELQNILTINGNRQLMEYNSSTMRYQGTNEYVSSEKLMKKLFPFWKVSNKRSAIHHPTWILGTSDLLQYDTPWNSKGNEQQAYQDKIDYYENLLLFNRFTISDLSDLNLAKTNLAFLKENAFAKSGEPFPYNNLLQYDASLRNSELFNRLSAAVGTGITQSYAYELLMYKLIYNKYTNFVKGSDSLHKEINYDLVNYPHSLKYLYVDSPILHLLNISKDPTLVYSYEVKGVSGTNLIPNNCVGRIKEINSSSIDVIVNGQKVNNSYKWSLDVDQLFEIAGSNKKIKFCKAEPPDTFNYLHSPLRESQFNFDNKLNIQVNYDISLNSKGDSYLIENHQVVADISKGITKNFKSDYSILPQLKCSNHGFQQGVLKYTTIEFENGKPKNYINTPSTGKTSIKNLGYTSSFNFDAWDVNSINSMEIDNVSLLKQKVYILHFNYFDPDNIIQSIQVFLEDTNKGTVDILTFTKSDILPLMPIDNFSGKLRFNIVTKNTVGIIPPPHKPYFSDFGLFGISNEDEKGNPTTTEVDIKLKLQLIGSMNLFQYSDSRQVKELVVFPTSFCYIEEHIGCYNKEFFAAFLPEASYRIGAFYTPDTDGVSAKNSIGLYGYTTLPKDIIGRHIRTVN